LWILVDFLRPNFVCLQFTPEYLKPDWWQKALRLGKSADHGDRWKAHLKGRAQALFPRVEVTLKTADALLILEAGRMQRQESR
jgi:hypothetical protein